MKFFLIKYRVYYLNNNESATLKDDPTLNLFYKTITKLENQIYSRSSLEIRIICHINNYYYYLAKNRLTSIISKLKKTKNNITAYSDIINTLSQKRLHRILYSTKFRNEFFLPHHVVIKQDRTTTKLRIVFDGSSKTNKPLSLNECLHKGPILLNDLANMLIIFRIGFVELRGDLEESFL